jgi:hypothetical protein
MRIDYQSEALSELKQRAEAQGLNVDSAATHEIYQVFGDALAKAKSLEGEGIFSAERQAQFNSAAAHLAVEAASAARRDEVQWIGSQHIADAVDMLRKWKIWPFTGG